MKLSELYDLKNRTALVTGGTGWLGASMVEALLELGAEVYVSGRNEQKGEELLSKLSQKNDGRLHFIKMQAENEFSIAECIRRVAAANNRIDVLINNAYTGKSSNLESIELGEWNDALNLGITSYFLCIKHAIPHMRIGGGSIINIASMYASVSPQFSIYEGTPFFSSPAYGAAKAAVIQLTRYTACDLAKYKIRVNSISPGAFPSIPVQQSEKFISRLSEKNPLGRIGEPWELKGPVSFLASSASSYMTGQNLCVDGGWTTW